MLPRNTRTGAVMTSSSDPREYAPLLSHDEQRRPTIDERQIAVILLEVLKPPGEMDGVLQRIVAGELLAHRVFIDLRRLAQVAARQMVRQRNP